MDEFNRKYTLDQSVPADSDGYRTYKAFDKRQISSPIKHNMYKNMPNWGPGQKQFGRAGDAHFVNPDSADSYFIGDAELNSTHVANPNGGASVNEARLNKIVSKTVKKALNEIMMTPAHFGMNKAKDFLSFEDFCKIGDEYRMGSKDHPEEMDNLKQLYDHLCNEWDEGDRHREDERFEDYVRDYFWHAGYENFASLNDYDDDMADFANSQGWDDSYNIG